MNKETIETIGYIALGIFAFIITLTTVMFIGHHFETKKMELQQKYNKELIQCAQSTSQ